MHAHNKALAALALSLAVLVAGCAERQAQVAVQTSLTGLAHGVVAADEAVSEALPDAAEAARSTVVDERAACDSGADPGCDDIERWMTRYDEIMQPWSQAVSAIRGLRDSLLIAQGAVTCWIEEGYLPHEWDGFCDGIETGVQGLLSLLEGLGIELPEVVSTIGTLSGQACEVAGPWFVGGEP